MTRVHHWAKACGAGVMAAAVLAWASTAGADTHYVDLASKAPAEPYATPQTASHDIYSAVAAAEAGDTVQVAAGAYKIDKTISVGKAITVVGAGADKTTIDAQSQCRAVTLAGGKLSGVTVTGGKAREGGGVQCGAGATVSGCTISGNEAERYGGGVCSRAGGKTPVLIADCKILNNRVTAFMHTDMPWGGGGVYAEPGTTVRNCLIEGNEAAQRAGGIWCHGGPSIAENCVITGNKAAGRRAHNPHGPGSMEEGGGGAYCDFGGSLRNCLIYANTAPMGGGAVLSTGGNAHNCTITANSAKAFGGGVQTLGIAGLVSCIVYGNTRGSGENAKPDDLYVYHYYHVDIHQLTLGRITPRNSCIGVTALHQTRQRFYLGPTAKYDAKWYKNTVNPVACIEKDPQFVDPAKHDYRLKSGSPCIDAGAAGEKTKIDKDLDGRDRVRGTAVDIGAYESPHAAPPASQP